MTTTKNTPIRFLDADYIIDLLIEQGYYDLDATSIPVRIRDAATGTERITRYATIEGLAPSGMRFRLEGMEDVKEALR